MRRFAAAQETELKDETGKTIIKYVIEVPQGIAPAGTTDPAKQVGLILCSQEHDNPTGNDIFPGRQSLLRQGLLDQYVLLAPAPQGRKFGPDDHEPIEKLIAWAKKTYPINPRRVYMYGKGEGSKISMEFTMMHPNIVTAAIGYSWGAWLMPSEMKEPLDFVNSAPEIYLTLGRRDLANHLSCVRDAYLRDCRQRDTTSSIASSTSSATAPIIRRAMTTRSAGRPGCGTRTSRLRRKRPSCSRLSTARRPRRWTATIRRWRWSAARRPAQSCKSCSNRRTPNVRAAAAETCRHGIFGDATTAALAKLVDRSIGQSAPVGDSRARDVCQLALPGRRRRH